MVSSKRGPQRPPARYSQPFIVGGFFQLLQKGAARRSSRCRAPAACGCGSRAAAASSACPRRPGHRRCRRAAYPGAPGALAARGLAARRRGRLRRRPALAARRRRARRRRAPARAGAADLRAGGRRCAAAGAGPGRGSAGQGGRRPPRTTATRRATPLSRTGPATRRHRSPLPRVYPIVSGALQRWPHAAAAAGAHRRRSAPLQRGSLQLAQAGLGFLAARVAAPAVTFR